MHLAKVQFGAFQLRVQMFQLQTLITHDKMISLLYFCTSTYLYLFRLFCCPQRTVSWSVRGSLTRQFVPKRMS